MKGLLLVDMYMFTTPGFEERDNKINMKAPTFFSCGCGSIRARLATVLQYVNISARQLNQVNTPGSAIAKKYLEQEGLDKEIPLLSKHVYGVLIDNKLTNGKHRWVDINQGAATSVAQQFREILNVPEPHK